MRPLAAHSLPSLRLPALRLPATRLRPFAFTLLEVILALAILAGSVAVLSEVLRLADRNANDAEAETRAQLFATSLLDEIASGLVELTEVQRQPIPTEDAGQWVYSVTIAPVDTDIDFSGLTSVEILVEQDLKKAFRPTQYRLSSWLYLPPEQASENTSDDSQEDSPSSSTEGG